MAVRSSLCILFAAAVDGRDLGAGGSPGGTADRNIFKAHMAFLADDLLEGRETGMRGFDIAARYVAEQFAQYGVQPKGDQGSYLQTVPLKTSRLVQDSPVFEIRRKSGIEALAYPDEFFMAPSLSADQTDFTAPLVFVGFGIISAPVQARRLRRHRRQRQDRCRAEWQSIEFSERGRRHYGSRRVKRELAAKHGAVGVILLQTPRAERVFPFAKLREYSDSLGMDWVTADGRGGSEIPGLQGGALLSMAAAGKLLLGGRGQSSTPSMQRPTQTNRCRAWT